MMKLYIQTQGGQPINHPAFEDNLLQAFATIPENWEPFVRVEKPIPTMYQVLEAEEPVYTKVNGVWTDVWLLHDMTAEEKAVKQQAAKDAWAAMPNYSNYTAWTFDEAICEYQPPTPRPVDLDKNYFWQGTTSSWVETPAYPTDGKEYKIDFATATWIIKT
jgi:hypothetical protein